MLLVMMARVLVVEGYNYSPTKLNDRLQSTLLCDILFKCLRMEKHFSLLGKMKSCHTHSRKFVINAMFNLIVSRRTGHDERCLT